jgi:hypothetical protein
MPPLRPARRRLAVRVDDGLLVVAMETLGGRCEGECMSRSGASPMTRASRTLLDHLSSTKCR